MLDRLRFAVFACVLVVGCSKKADNTKAAGSASKSTPTAPAPAASAPAAPTAGNAAGCDECQKFQTCCEALVKVPNSNVEKSDCNTGDETRLKGCIESSDDMRGDINDTCKDRLTDLQKDHPNVAECK